MSYSPGSTPIYLRAFSGCLAGLGARAGRLTMPGDNTGLLQMAAAFAQQVDTAWAANGGGTPTKFALATIESSSASIWIGRSPLESAHAFLPLSYEGIATGIATAAIAADAQIIGAGIDPDDFGGSSAGGGNVTAGGVSVTPSSPVTQVVASMPADSVLFSVAVIVIAPFNGSPSVRLRTGVGTLLAPSEVPLGIVGQYAQDEEQQNTNPDVLMLDFSAGGATTGQAYVTFLVGNA